MSKTSLYNDTIMTHPLTEVSSFTLSLLPKASKILRPFPSSLLRHDEAASVYCCPFAFAADFQKYEEKVFCFLYFFAKWAIRAEQQHQIYTQDVSRDSRASFFYNARQNFADAMHCQH